MVPTSKDFIIFTLESYIIGVEVNHVDEVALPTAVKPLPISSSALLGLFRIRQTACPLIDITKLLELRPSQAINEDEKRILIVNSRNQTFGIEVEHILDIITTSEEHVLNPSEVTDTPPFIKHTIITQNKQTVHILDIEALINTVINQTKELFILQS